MNDRTKAMQKQYRIDHQEDIKANKKLYYLTNKVHIIEYQEKYRISRQERVYEYNQEYYAENHEAMNARARAKRLPGILHRRMIKEFKSKYSPWNEGHVKGVYQVDFD